MSDSGTLDNESSDAAERAIVELDDDEQQNHVQCSSEFAQPRSETSSEVFDGSEKISTRPITRSAPTTSSFLDGTRKTMFGRPVLPPDAKVVMLLKAEKPGDKPRLVKLEPVANPSKPDIRSAYEALRKAAQKQPPPQTIKTRKRRIIPPVVRTKSFSKGNEQAASSRSTRSKRLKTDGSGSEDVEPDRASKRPRRTHKAPQRYGDYIEQHQDAAVVNLEREAEETEGPDNGDRAVQDVGSEQRVDVAVDDDDGDAKKEGKNTKRLLKEFFTANVIDDNDDDDIDDEDSSNEENVDVDGGDEDNEEGDQSEETCDGASKISKDEQKAGDMTSSKGKLECDRCHRYFANNNSMNAHRFKVHRIVIRASVKCPGCDHKATTIHTLNDHVAEEHGLKLQYVKRKFNNTTEFQNYLDDLAATQNMGFVRHRKSQNKRQLYCNRSGAVSNYPVKSKEFRINKGDAIRNRPRKGTAKIGAMCPAHMFYTECEDGSIEVNGQLTHFGHALDPRFVFPATSSEKVTSRVRTGTSRRSLVRSANRPIPVDLQERSAASEDGSFVNVDAENTGEIDMASASSERQLDDETLEEQYGPVHPNSEEIDIRMRNIDRLCSFLFDNVSEQLYRLNDETMDLVLRALRTTQNSISNLNSMIIQIKEGDPDVVQKFQRRGPRYNQWMQWMPSRSRQQEMIYSPRQQRRPVYEADDYDEDTVYYRHVPMRANDEYDSVYVVDEGHVETQGEEEADEQYYEQY